MHILSILAIAYAAALNRDNNQILKAFKRNPESDGVNLTEDAITTIATLTLTGSQVPQIQTEVPTFESHADHEVDIAEALLQLSGTSPSSKKRHKPESILSGSGSYFPDIEDDVNLPQTMSQAEIPTQKQRRKKSRTATSTMNQTIPQFEQDRNLRTVNQVWDEYSYGIDGNPSVKSLDEKYGGTWKITASERSLYYRRKVIIDSIKTLMSQNITEPEAVNEVERIREENFWTLGQLTTNLPSFDHHIQDGHLVLLHNSDFGSYKQCRNLATVRQVWDEYTIGVYGGPSIQSLDEKYGSAWRATIIDENFYAGRTKIYSLIKELIEKGKTPEEAVAEVEEFRLKNNWSLTSLRTSVPIVVIENDTGNLRLNSSLPGYKQFRNLTTVFQVWQEYADGLEGNPSVKSLDDKFGPNWRTGENSRFYSSRKQIYELIIKFVNSGKPLNEVLHQLEALRLRNSWTLSLLQSRIPLGTFTFTSNGMQYEPITPIYTLARNLTTVKEIWEEYTIGINGNPSVESLSRIYGARWRKSATESSYYYHRSKIYKWITSKIQNGTSGDEAIAELENRRVSNRWSVLQLQKAM